MECKVMLVLSLMFVLVQCHDIKLLQCSEIAKKPMSRVSEFFHCTPRYIEWMNAVVCERRTEKSTQYYAMEMIFKVLDEVPYRGDTSRCVGLDIFFVSTKDYTGNNKTTQGYASGADPLIPVGILKSDPRCWNSTGSCEVYMPNDLLKKQIFSFVPPPFLNGFWNFSEPYVELPLLEFEDYPDILFTYFLIPILKQNVAKNSIEILWLPITDIEHLLESSQIYGIFTDNKRSRFFDDNAIGTSDINYFTLHERKGMEGNEETDKAVILGGIFNYNYSLPIDELSKLNTLQSLILRQVPILFTSKRLPLLPKLKDLVLSECEIIEIFEEDLKNFPALEYLDLSGNSITYLSDTTFIHQHNLQRLDLSRNQLTVWPILHGCSLQLLDLSQNSLDYMENLGTFGTTVDYLNISSNEIKKWEDQKIFSLNETEGPWVKIVNLSNNLITNLSEAMITSFNGLQYVDLAGNHLKCGDCKTRLNTNFISLGRISSGVTPLRSVQVHHLLSFPFFLLYIIPQMSSSMV